MSVMYESEEEKWRERREKKNKKRIKLIPHHSVPLQICNGTVHMLQKLWDLTHLIFGVFCAWCGKCAKYLAFGTFTTPTVGALKIVERLQAELRSGHNGPPESKTQICTQQGRGHGLGKICHSEINMQQWDTTEKPESAQVVCAVMRCW